MKKEICFTILLSITTQLSALDGSVENQKDLCRASYEKVLSDLLAAASSKSSCSEAEVEFENEIDKTRVIIGGVPRWSYSDDGNGKKSGFIIQHCFHSESSSNFFFSLLVTFGTRNHILLSTTFDERSTIKGPDGEENVCVLYLDYFLKLQFHQDMSKDQEKSVLLNWNPADSGYERTQWLDILHSTKPHKDPKPWRKFIPFLKPHKQPKHYVADHAYYILSQDQLFIDKLHKEFLYRMMMPVKID